MTPAQKSVTDLYVQGLIHVLSKRRSKTNPAAKKQYMRNKFEFFSITSVDSRVVNREYMNLLEIAGNE